MRRTLSAVACVALVAMGAPATSSADVLDVYGDLAERKLRPAPLVPTGVPPSLRPLDRTVTTHGSRRRSGYGLRLVNTAPEAVVLLEGGTFKTVKAALREGRRMGFEARRTRVRGRRGHLLTRHLGPPQWMLVWVEDRRVYTLGTGTPRKVSLRQLRATAAKLEHLTGAYAGTPDPATSTEAQVVTTDRTVTIYATWEAACTFYGDTCDTGALTFAIDRRSG